MNKYQEALDKLKYIESCDIGELYVYEVFGDSVEILQELVDKAAPKKALEVDIGIKERTVMGWECPICDRRILKNMKYCVFCGQELDWGEDDE